jgi:hypothetical protein
MPQEQISNETAALVRLAAIMVPADRLTALEAGLAATRVVAAALARYDYGLIEPASRFAPPASR